MPKFEEREVPVQQLVQIKNVIYSPKDIEDLILQDLVSKGWTVNSVKFKTDYAYETDEMGMNRRMIISFVGALAEIK